MNHPNEKVILKKLKSLPPERVAEVEDFVDFLRARNEERSTTRAAAGAAEPVFSSIWENEDDAAYDTL